MGQYYHVLTKGEDGIRKVYDPGSSLYMAYSGINAEQMARFRDEHHHKNEDGTWTFTPYPEEYYRYAYGQKLMENGEARSLFVAAVVNELRGGPLRVAWLGDYVEEKDWVRNPNLDEDDYDLAWNRDRDPIPFSAVPGPFDGLTGYLVNHDRGEYLDLRDTEFEEQFSAHPLSVMTAIGNGRGGGDYRGTNMGLVGLWALDLLEVVDAEPEGMTRIPAKDMSFVETW